MYKKLEALGSSLLARFVPRVDASAASPALCQFNHYSYCTQCGSSCWAYCCAGQGCPGPFLCEN